MIFPTGRAREGGVVLGASGWDGLTYSPSHMDALKQSENISAKVHGKWNFYVNAWGQPKDKAQLARIRSAILSDLRREGLSVTPAQVAAASGSFVTGGLSVSTVINNALPWYLKPKNVLLLGGAGVVVYFTWPLLLKAGAGTIKRGVRSLAK